jgi:hypothetical protein
MKLRRIKATMTYKTSIAVNSIIQPSVYLSVIEKCSMNLIERIEDLMIEYNVPTNKDLKRNLSTMLVDNDYFISYNKMLEITENMLGGKTFEYYQNMKIVSLFLPYKGSSCVVNLAIPYGKGLLLDEVIQVMNIYMYGKSTSGLDAGIKAKLIIKQKYAYPNFQIAVSRDNDYYKVIFDNKKSANAFLSFIKNAHYGKNN